MATKATSREEVTTPGAAKGSSILEAIQRLRQEEMESRAATSAPAGVYESTTRRTEEVRGEAIMQPAAEPRGRAAAVVPLPETERRGWSVNFFGPTAHSMAMYCRQLATLVDVGIPLLEALRILARRGSNRQLADVSGSLAARVEEGMPLSSAMEEHRGIFSSMFVGVVRAGEAGGILDESLRRLADLLERRAALRSRVTSALWYPAIALFVEICVIFFIMFFAMPKLLSAYPDHSKLPGITLALLGFSQWFAKWWWLAILLAAAVILLIMYALRQPRGREVWDRTKLYIPGVGGLSRKINVARFSRTLGNLTAAGIPLIDAIGIAADTADNAVVTPTLYRVRSAVERGEKMDTPMRSEPIFDDVVIDMVMVGDEAGALDATLLKIADTYDVEVDSSLRRMTAILEPILIITLGLTVAFIALAVFLPYFKLISSPVFMVE
ncbi:MAG: type II secretion system F family protein [Candidatus Sumerlaeaceae bacterium]